MMRSESTSALGHPRLTNPTFGWRRLMRGRNGTRGRTATRRGADICPPGPRNGTEVGFGAGISLFLEIRIRSRLLLTLSRGRSRSPHKTPFVWVRAEVLMAAVAAQRRPLGALGRMGM